MSIWGLKRDGIEEGTAHSDRDLFDAIMLIAKNDGDSYRKKDPKGAIRKAITEYVSLEMGALRSDLKGMQSRLEKELGAYWKRN